MCGSTNSCLTLLMILSDDYSIEGKYIYQIQYIRFDEGGSVNNGVLCYVNNFNYRS